jgi:hypothetical protein
MWFIRFYNGFWGRVWKIMEKQARKGLECYKQSLMGDSGRRSKDQNDNRNENIKDCAHEASGGKEDSLGN